MTRETAINLLDNLIGMVEDNQQNDYDEAFKLAIRSLKSWDEDVAPVVRCKDCMHTEIDKYAPAECQNRCKLSHQYHEPNFFCKCGEPRMDLLEWIHKGDADEQGV